MHNRLPQHKKEILVRLDIDPQSKLRHRSYIKRSGRIGTHSPIKTKIAERTLLVEYMKQAKKCLFNVPISLDICYGIKMSKSWPEKKKALMDGSPHIYKPDRDNLDKLVKDGLNGYAWLDDKLIYCGSSIKKWTREPFISMKITYFMEYLEK